MMKNRMKGINTNIHEKMGAPPLQIIFKTQVQKAIYNIWKI